MVLERGDMTYLVMRPLAPSEQATAFMERPASE